MSDHDEDLKEIETDSLADPLLEKETTDTEFRNDITPGVATDTVPEAVVSAAAVPEEADPVPESDPVEDVPDTAHEAAPDTASEYTVDDYKEHIRRLKREYRRTKKEEKRARQRAAGSAGKTRPGLTVLISVLSTLLCVAVLGALLLYFPSKESSLFATLVKKYNASNSGYSRTSREGARIGDDEVAPGSQVTINVDGESSTAAAYAKASPSVVAIMTVEVSGAAWENQTETGLSQGAGVVVSEDGEILTNFHVIDSIVDRSAGSIGKNYKAYVYFGSSLVEPYEVVSLIGYDEESDLALIKVDREGLVPIEFADSEKLSVGEKVIAIGSPGGIEFMNSVCDGVISGLKRSISSSSSGDNKVLYDMIQMTAPINPGNSGGAVVNSEGKLVGISVIKVVAENYENMSFAISSNTARRIIDSFRKYGKYVKPVLGVTIDTRYNWSAAKKNNWSQGAYVDDVTKGTCADEAGIKREDIICAIEGFEVLDFAGLRTELLKYAPGDTITLRIYRHSEDKFYDLSVTLRAA